MEEIVKQLETIGIEPDLRFFRRFRESFPEGTMETLTLIQRFMPGAKRRYSAKETEFGVSIDPRFCS